MFGWKFNDGVSIDLCFLQNFYHTVCPVAETFGDYISKFSQFGDYISKFGQIWKIAK